MIYLVANILNIFANTLRTALVLASTVGEVIVLILSGAVTIVLRVLHSLISFLLIIYEDNIFIFTEELPNFTANVLKLIEDQGIIFCNALVVSSESIYARVHGTLRSIAWSVSAVLTILTEVSLLIKNTVILIGNTIWLIVTFIPFQLPMLLRLLFKHLKDVIVEFVVNAYYVLLKFTNFLTDVPLESLVGLISAIIIVRLCVHFRETISDYSTVVYWSVVRKLLYIYHTVYNYFTDSEVRTIAHMASGQGADVVGTTPEVGIEDDDRADALCVICQERQKCVLILPCRHVCLCGECCLRLYGYQRTCPICRTFIYHSVTIYL